MQIHELTQRARTDEGLVDLGRRAAAATARGVGAVQQAGARIAQPFKDVKDTYTQARTGQQTATIAGHALEVWKKYADQLYAATQDKNQYPDLYKKTLTAFVQKNLMAGNSISRATNSTQISSIIDQLVQAETKARSAQTKTATAANPAATAPATTAPATTAKPAATTTAPAAAPAGRAQGGGKVAGQLSQNPAAVKKRQQRAANKAAPLKESATPQEQQLFTQLVQQAALSQPEADAPAMKKGAEIINQDPAIIRFQGTTYGLNDNGNWSDIKTGKVPNQSVAAFLDQVAGIK